MATKYAEKLKDPRWQRKRLEILQRDDFTCRHCGDTKTTLHVHHEVYLGPDPWDTPEYCLITICEDCHKVNHLDLSELELYLIELFRLQNRGNTKMTDEERMERAKLFNRVITNYVNDRG